MAFSQTPRRERIFHHEKRGKAGRTLSLTAALLARGESIIQAKRHTGKRPYRVHGWLAADEDHQWGASRLASRRQQTRRRLRSPTENPRPPSAHTARLGWSPSFSWPSPQPALPKSPLMATRKPREAAKRSQSKADVHGGVVCVCVCMLDEGRDRRALDGTFLRPLLCILRVWL